MVKNVRRMDSNRWATVGLLEITNPHKYWAFWVSYATSPTKQKRHLQGVFFVWLRIVGWMRTAEGGSVEAARNAR